MIDSMLDKRVHTHPILDIERGSAATIYWQGKPLRAFFNESVSSALIANGINVFGTHPKANTPQGIFCANGQCSQCMLMIDGLPKKACVEPVRNGMEITPISNLPELPPVNIVPHPVKIKKIKKEVLIIGGGPAGLSAAHILGGQGIEVLLIDDRQKLGGKLILQTHRFFGASETVHAGKRGIDIAEILAEQACMHSSVETWTNSTAVGVFTDQRVGILKHAKEYVLVEPEVLLVAAGAREKHLVFKGNTLPGIIGAGAFQTLVNRDLVLPATRLFIIGGGNVGLIAGYHAIQAGIEVVGLAEMMPACSGYKVHLDKLTRLGVPIFTSHTVIRADGDRSVSSITISPVDDNFHPQPGLETTFACDGVLLAVGLDPLDALYQQARAVGMPAYAAGDADEIAEASAAIISGKIQAGKIAQFVANIAEFDLRKLENIKTILASKPGKQVAETHLEQHSGVYPVLHCTQEIPCDPCAKICPLGLIQIKETDIREIPLFVSGNTTCTGCAKCLVNCPGLAITLVDYRKNTDAPVITIPFELADSAIKTGTNIEVVDTGGHVLETVPVLQIIDQVNNRKTQLMKVAAPVAIAEKIAGMRIPRKITPDIQATVPTTHAREKIVCICEHVTDGAIRALVRQGMTDLNAIKAITRAGMGPCGGKSCEQAILRILREEGFSPEQTVPFTNRPLEIEMLLSHFCTAEQEQDQE